VGKRKNEVIYEWLYDYTQIGTYILHQCKRKPNSFSYELGAVSFNKDFYEVKYQKS
jgi:hypothetical protein